MLRSILWMCMLTLLTGCNLLNSPMPTVQIASASVTPPATPTASRDYVPVSFPDGIVDALPILSGICFEAAFDAAGQVFVLRTAQEQANLYDLADRSGLCPRPVTRYPFDFSAGMTLAGLWSRGIGCTAEHQLLTIERTAQRVLLQLRFVTRGSCPYELVRPFWVGIPDASTAEIMIEVVEHLQEGR